MKATINGVRYDTKASEVLADVYCSKKTDDWHWWSERLFRTRRSERYFLVGDGGKLTIWADRSVLPLTKDEALSWAKRHLAPAKFNKVFP